MLIGFSFLWKVSRDFLSSVANSKQCIKPFTKWVYRIIRAEREKRERIKLHDFISISDVFTLFDFYFDPHTHTNSSTFISIDRVSMWFSVSLQSTLDKLPNLSAYFTVFIKRNRDRFAAAVVVHHLIHLWKTGCLFIDAVGENHVNVFFHDKIIASFTIFGFHVRTTTMMRFPHTSTKKVK